MLYSWKKIAKYLDKDKSLNFIPTWNRCSRSNDGCYLWLWLLNFRKMEFNLLLMVAKVKFDGCWRFITIPDKNRCCPIESRNVVKQGQQQTWTISHRLHDIQKQHWLKLWKKMGWTSIYLCSNHWNNPKTLLYGLASKRTNWPRSSC